MADLTGETVGAAQQGSPGNNAATDTGSERHHHGIVGILCRTDLPFGHGRAGGVVVDVDGHVEALTQQSANREVVDVDQVGGGT